MRFPEKLLGEFARVFVGLAAKQSEPRESERSSPVLTVRALTDAGSIDPVEIMHADFGHRPLDKYRVEPGDVLLAARSTSLKAAIVPPQLKGAVINATIIAIRCLEKMEPRLLAAYLGGSFGEALLRFICPSGTNQMNLTVTSLQVISVPVPPKDEQLKLVAMLEAADEAHHAATEAARLRRRLVREIVVKGMLGQTPQPDR